MIDDFTNILYTEDNLFILNGLNSNIVDLIYLDPPFNSKRMYSAPVGSKATGITFKDMWTWADVNEAYLETLAFQYPSIIKFVNSVSTVHSKAMAAYLTYMAQRLVEMYRVLKDTGSICLHCDPTAGHYLKMLLDMIFGRKNFRNEIIWCYTGPGSPNMRQFNRKSDTIFWYSKGDTWTFNKDDVRLPYKDKNQTFRKIFDTKGGWTQEDVTNLRNRGKVPENWWTDIAIVARSKYERTGYPTQKPLALLNRIIKALSNEGDMVMDTFCGCATTCVAAQQLKRKWIGIDVEKKAVNILQERLSDDAGMFKNFINTSIIPQRTDIERVPANNKSIKSRLYKEQKGKCNGCGIEFLERNLSVDHIIPVHHGGGSYYENYQLLCPFCNSTKGKRPMEYLRMKLKKQEELLNNEVIFDDDDSPLI